MRGPFAWPTSRLRAKRGRNCFRCVRLSKNNCTLWQVALTNDNRPEVAVILVGGPPTSNSCELQAIRQARPLGVGKRRDILQAFEHPSPHRRHELRRLQSAPLDHFDRVHPQEKPSSTAITSAAVPGAFELSTQGRTLPSRTRFSPLLEVPAAEHRPCA